MSKAHRGTGIRKDPNHGRGVCPVCGKQQIKTLYDQEIDGKKLRFASSVRLLLKTKLRQKQNLLKRLLQRPLLPLKQKHQLKHNFICIQFQSRPFLRAAVFF